MDGKFVSPGTPLTNYQRELLTFLVEECAEVAQRATKAMRFGLDETQKGQPFDNSVRLGHELGDLSCVVGRMIKEHMIFEMDIDQGAENKSAQLKRWMQHDGPKDA